MQDLARPGGQPSRTTDAWPMLDLGLPVYRSQQGASRWTVNQGYYFQSKWVHSSMSHKVSFRPD
jgi:hypothetical protein